MKVTQLKQKLFFNEPKQQCTIQAYSSRLND